ncbi:MAG: adenosylmethionine decarboxylase [Desulfovibrionaceae bacterium]
MLESTVGTHCILELVGCPVALLNDEAYVRRAAATAVHEAGCTLIGLQSHRFSPQGVTALALLAESHLSIHTWPEHGFAAVDMFTCGPAESVRTACAGLVRAFRATEHSAVILPRGRGMAESVLPEYAVRLT